MIRLKEKVMAIESSDGGATVATASGSVYRGSIVVGADGVHSIVRQEIWKMREKCGLDSTLLKERSSTWTPKSYGYILGN